MWHQGRKSSPHGLKVERLFAWKVGNPETTADVHHSDVTGCDFAQLDREIGGFLLRLTQGGRIQYLRTRKDLESLEPHVHRLYGA